MLPVATTPLSNALPAELWAYIFAFTISGPTDSYSNFPYASVNRAPLLLGRVSRRWREISLSTPELWSVLRFSSFSLQDGAAILYGVERWLERSQSRPLHIAFRSTGNFDSNSPVQVIWNHLPRIRTLVMDLSIWDCPPFSRALGTLPLLEAIHLRARDASSARMIDPILNAYLPGLRRLTISTDAPALHLSLNQHSSQLTHLSVTTFQLGEHPFSFLQNCRNLRSCTLTFRGQLLAEAYVGKVVLPHLYALHLTIRYASRWEDLFAVSTFPALKELTVSGAIWPLPSFVPFLHRSRCVLRALNLSDTNIDEDALMTVLSEPQVNAHVERLQVVAHIGAKALPLSDACIRALDPSRTAPVLLPRMVEIFVGSTQWLALPWKNGAFADMIVARSCSPVPLVRVELHGSTHTGTFHTKDYDTLRDLGEKQPQIKVTLWPASW